MSIIGTAALGGRNLTAMTHFLTTLSLRRSRSLVLPLFLLSLLSLQLHDLDDGVRLSSKSGVV
jgi:hypothetical protein